MVDCEDRPWGELSTALPEGIVKAKTVASSHDSGQTRQNLRFMTCSPTPPRINGTNQHWKALKLLCDIDSHQFERLLSEQWRPAPKNSLLPESVALFKLAAIALGLIFADLYVTVCPTQGRRGPQREDDIRSGNLGFEGRTLGRGWQGEV